jgi:hypothetical protein
MNRNRILGAALAGLTAAAVACSDSNTPSLVSEEELTEDIAVTSGDAIADDVAELILNENAAGLPTAAPRPAFHLFGMPPGVTVTRTVTFYDALGNEQDSYDPVTTASIAIEVTMDGSFSRTFEGRRGTESMERAVHRDRSLVISGLEGEETSRTHDGVGTSLDSTTITFTGSGEDAVTVTREIVESAVDSVVGIVLNLPRSQNPWPVAGTIIRRVSAEFTITVGDRTETRSRNHRVQVTFPADDQGNVTIQIDDRTCTLNLVTHRISDCTTS